MEKVCCLKCGDHLTKSTSTIGRHLESHHKIKKPDETGSLNKQPKLHSLLCVAEKNEKVHLMSGELKEKINGFMILAIASSSVPNSFIDNKYLREVLCLLNKTYRPISRNQISANISKLHGTLVESIQSEILDLKNFSLCIDFWPKKITGFLGITLNYVKNSQLKNLLITLEQVDFSHTSDVVLEKTNASLNTINF